MPAHVLRLLVLMVAALIMALAARLYLTPESFYAYGHYRAAAVTEIASAQPRYLGAGSCVECHADTNTTWNEGIHAALQCETCHGAAAGHPDSLPMEKITDTRQLCPLCHEAMVGRPSAQPQVDVASHAGEEQCNICHNPHSPRIGGAPVAMADTATDSAPRIASSISAPDVSTRCIGCHGPTGLGNGIFPALAGLERQFLAARLADYRSGAISNPMMNAVSGGLSDEEIETLSNYYSAIKP